MLRTRQTQAAARRTRIRVDEDGEPRLPSFADGEAAGGREARPAMASASRNLAYPWTLNNPTEEEIELLKRYEDPEVRAAFNIRYICFGFEVAPTTGTPHLQGFVRYEAKKAKTMSAAHKVPGFARAAMIVARGNDEENRNYCMKGEAEGAPPKTVGTRPETDYYIYI